MGASQRNPPKWSGWEVFQQVASSLGKLVDVDRYSLFSNQFAMVRLKIKCKDPHKIPEQRVLEIQDELYILNYKVEGYKQKQLEKGKDDGGDDGDDPDIDEDDDLLEEELEEINKRTQDPKVGGGGGSGGSHTQNNSKKRPRRE